MSQCSCSADNNIFTEQQLVDNKPGDILNRFSDNHFNVEPDFDSEYVSSQMTPQETNIYVKYYSIDWVQIVSVILLLFFLYYLLKQTPE
jgi:hypothetical protein